MKSRSMVDRWRVRWFVFLCLVALLWSGGTARAATRTWNGGTDANWNTSANWNEGALGSGNTPTFGAAGTSGTNLNNDTTAGTSIAGITFTSNAPGYTINGNAIALTGNIGSTAPTSGGARTHTIGMDMDLGTTTRTITIAGNATDYHNITLSGILSGTAGLTRNTSAGANSALLTLSGLNTFSGKFTINGNLTEINTIADTGVACSIGVNGVFSLSGGLLRYTGPTASTDRQIELAANATLLNNSASNGAMTFRNAIFNVALTPGAARTLALGGSSSATNEIQGVIQDNNTDTVGVTLGGSSYSGGKWRFSGTNTYSGITTLSYGGVLEAATLANGGSASSVGASGNAAANLVFGTTGGTLRYVGSANARTDRAFTYPSTQSAILESSGAGTVTFDSPDNAFAFPTTTANASLTLGGSNTGTNALGKNLVNNPSDNSKVLTLTKTGAGTWVLAGSNTYSGNTILSGGALDVGASAVGLSTNSYVKLDGGALQASGAFTRSNSTTANGANFQWSSANGGGFAARGGTLTVTVGNNAATEQTWGAAAGNNAIWGTLLFGSGCADSEIEFQNNINLLSSSTNLSRTINVVAGVGGDVATLSGVIRNASGTAGLVKTGAGALNLTAANTYNGGTSVSNGTLWVNNTAGSGTGGGVVTVYAGGYIGGNGTISNTLVMAGGCLAATVGNVLKVQGGVDLSALNDGIVLVGPAPVARTVVLTYTGTLTGTFNNAVGIVADYSVDKEIAIRPPSAPGTVLSVN